MKGKLYDITPLVSENIAVFPGDTPFSREVALDFKQGHNLVLSAFTMSAHTGAHTDAPNHYHPSGQSIEQRSLDNYIGACQVIEVSKAPAERIKPEDINLDDIHSNKVLFKTNSFTEPDKWTDDFNSLSPELVSELAKKNIKLIGIDTPSVDPAKDKELLSHNEIYKNDISILEGIILTEVQPGNYTLIALPLKIKDADATPVRAVLIEGQI